MTCHKFLATAALLLVFTVWTCQAVNFYKQGKDNGNSSPPSRGSRPPARGQDGPSNSLWIRTRDAPIDTIRYRTPMDRRMVPASMLFQDRSLDKRLIDNLFPSSDNRMDRYRRLAQLLNTENDL